MAGAQKNMDARATELALHDWFATQIGCELFDHEKAVIRSLLDRKLAFHLVQLDCGSFKPVFATKHAGCGSLVSLHPSGAHCPNILADAHQLPFAPRGIDVVVAYHYLDFCQDPRQVLRQIDISLADSGSVLVCGMNPLSPLKWFNKQRIYKGRVLSKAKLIDWLSVLGYEIENEQYVSMAYYSQLSWLKPWRWLVNKLMQLFPVLSPSYVVMARKQSLATIGSGRVKLKKQPLVGATASRAQL